jgi:hypothetical protein
MIDPMPRQDLQQPPTAREAELMAEIERLRGVLASMRDEKHLTRVVYFRRMATVALKLTAIADKEPG